MDGTRFFPPSSYYTTPFNSAIGFAFAKNKVSLLHAQDEDPPFSFLVRHA